MPQEWIEYIENIDKDGPDGDIILLEIELPNVARIFIGKKLDQINQTDIFAITVVVYGELITTSYFKRMEDAMEHTDAVKIIIQVLSNNHSALFT